MNPSFPSELDNLQNEYILGINNGYKEDGKTIKKSFLGITKGWTHDEAEMMAKGQKNVMGVMKKIVLKNSGIICIDIDEDLDYLKMVNLHPILKTTLFVKGNTKGGHFYFKTDWKPTKDYIDHLDQTVGDIITNQMFELVTKQWNDKSIQFISTDDLKTIVKQNKHDIFDDETDIKSVSTVESASSSVVYFGYYEQSIVDNIKQEFYTSYMDWLKFIWAIRFSFQNPVDIADRYSKPINGYVSREDVESKMMDARHERIGFPYLMNLSKKSDIVRHKQILIDKSIQDFKEDYQSLFDLKNTEFEKTHCKILDKGFYIRDENNIIEILSENQMKACYKHIQCGFHFISKKPLSFINEWLDCNNNIRSKKGIGIYPKNCPENNYNLWKPFDMELTTEWEEKLDAISLFKQHISILCNHEKDVSDWFIRWIAQFIQFPEIKTTMPTFVSSQGAGKNTLLELIRKLIGNSRVFETTDPARDVFGAFNSRMADSFLVILSELSPNDMKNADGKIKGLITDGTICINTKGVKQYEIDSYHRFITFTNNGEAIKPVKGDRRNVVIRCSDELCKIDSNGIPKSDNELQKINQYIEQFRSILDDIDSQKTIYEYLKSLNVSNFHTEQPPKTEFHKLQSELTMSPIEQFIRHFTLEHHDKDEIKLSSGSLYLQFKDWCGIYNKGYECSNQQFGVRLRNLNIQGIEKGSHTKNGETKIFIIQTLKQRFNISILEKEEIVEEIGHQEL